MPVKKYFKIVTYVVAFIGIGPCSIWCIHKYYSDKAFEEKYAQYFDEAMTVSYPMMYSYAKSLNARARLYEYTAKKANSQPRNLKTFHECFEALNNQYLNESQKIEIILLDLKYKGFCSSIPYSLWWRDSKSRKNESRSFREIEYARQTLEKIEDSFLMPDSIIQLCREVKSTISEAIMVMDKYRTSIYDINAWVEWNNSQEGWFKISINGLLYNSTGKMPKSLKIKLIDESTLK